MKLTALAVAAVLALPVLAQEAPTPSIWGQVVKIAGGAALVKTVMDIYDWLGGKAVPNPNALHYCAPSICNFSAAGTTPTQADLDMALGFIASLGKVWNKGETITLCNGWTCIDFEYTESGFEAVASYPDPKVGYGNKPRTSVTGGGGDRVFVAPNHYGTNLSVGGGGGARTRIGIVTISQ
jgi:hypothetical protein